MSDDLAKHGIVSKQAIIDEMGDDAAMIAIERQAFSKDVRIAELEREVASLRRLFRAGMEAQETLIRASGGPIRVTQELRTKVYQDTLAKRGAHAFTITDDDDTGDQIWTADDTEVELSPADVLERKMLKEHYGVGS
jgi:hypothetical protein